MRNRTVTMHDLCLEAVRQRGTDIKAIESYVRERIESMSEDDKSRLQQEIARVLAFRAPSPGIGSLH